MRSSALNFALVIFAKFLLSTQLLAQIPTSGLTAYYPLDGNARESSSAQLDGSNTGAIASQDRFSRSGMAMYLAGNAVINFQSLPSLGAANTQFSVSIWFKAAGLGPIVGDYYGTATAGDDVYAYELQVDNNTSNGNSPQGSLVASSRNSAMGLDYTSYNRPGVIVDNTWHHAVYTMDGFSSCRLYLDGALAATLPYNANLNYAQQPRWAIGNTLFKNQQQYFTGYVDDFRVYSRALSSTEVAQLYQAEATPSNTAPAISIQPTSQSVTSGNTASFSVTASGTSPFSYQWNKDGTTISGATSSTYIISGASTKDAGGYSVTVTNISGSVTSSVATLTVAAPKLSNLSVRTTLDANQIVIVGLTMSGGGKTALIRAVGPTLATFGVPNVMQDPKIELYNRSVKIDANDNWSGSAYLSTVFKSVGAFAYSSSSSLDAALVATIDGGRTIQASGPSAGTVLVEAYDAGSGDNPRFTNISARNKVGTGANILIAGFTLEGSGTRNLLIRAVGPKLTDFGVPNILADPKLEVYSGNSKIAENDNWASSLASTFASVGAFGLNTGSKDAAITVSLPAGGYTVQVSGADGGVGEAIVEIYELP